MQPLNRTPGITRKVLIPLKKKVLASQMKSVIVGNGHGLKKRIRMLATHPMKLRLNGEQ